MILSDIGPVLLVGAGKMGLSLARGWIEGGLPPSALVLVDPTASDDAKSFSAKHGVRLQLSPEGVLTHVLVLAVKPQIISSVMVEVEPVVGPHTLVLSIAAGISLAQLSEGLGTKRIVRTMPNTPAQLGKGITGAVPLSISDADHDVVDALLSAVGAVEWFAEESAIDGVTAVSGSGPAYVFYMVEALAAAAEQQGFDPEQAMRLARATIIGAAALLDADPAPASQLRKNVTSPNGTTAAALEVLMGPDGLAPVLAKAVAAARRRSEELGKR